MCHATMIKASSSPMRLCPMPLSGLPMGSECPLPPANQRSRSYIHHAPRVRCACSLTSYETQIAVPGPSDWDPASYHHSQLALFPHFSISTNHISGTFCLPWMGHEQLATPTLLEERARVQSGSGLTQFQRNVYTSSPQCRTHAIKVWIFIGFCMSLSLRYLFTATGTPPSQ